MKQFKKIGIEALQSVYRVSIDSQNSYVPVWDVPNHAGTSYAYQKQIRYSQQYTININEKEFEELVTHLGMLYADDPNMRYPPNNMEHFRFLREQYERAIAEYDEKIAAIEKEEALIKSDPNLKKAWDHLQTLKQMLNKD